MHEKIFNFAYALDYVNKTKTVHQPIEEIKNRLDSLEEIRNRDPEELDTNIMWMISRALIATAIDLGEAYGAQVADKFAKK